MSLSLRSIPGHAMFAALNCTTMGKLTTVKALPGRRCHSSWTGVSTNKPTADHAAAPSPALQLLLATDQQQLINPSVTTQAVEILSMWNPFGYFNLPQGFVGSFLASQFTTLPYPEDDFSGKTIIVTGANTGLGLEAARHFVRLNASKVIIGCRSVEKGENARKNIEETTKRTGIVEVWQVDLNSYESVKKFCSRAQKLERLDVVTENAGLATPHYQEIDGMESTIMVNVISTFLMALLLLPKLRADAIKFNVVPRLTIVASDAHEQAVFREQSAPHIFNALKSPKYQSDKYNTSKLLEILTIRELAPAMTASGKPQVILNTLTPGFCYSDLMRHAIFPLNVLAWIGKRLIGRSTEMGSRTLVAAASVGEESHGKYMTDCRVREPSKWVRSEKGKEAQKKVYKELLMILEEIEPGVTRNI